MQSLKAALNTPPVLCYPDFTQPFIPTIDASTSALGFVLSQKINDIERLVAYAGSSVSKPEFKYPITVLECLAVISELKYFFMYVCHSPVTIVTDHSALQHILQS